MDESKKYVVITYDESEDRPFVVEFETVKEAIANLETYPYRYGTDAIIAKKLVRRVAFDEGDDDS